MKTLLGVLAFVSIAASAAAADATSSSTRVAVTGTTVIVNHGIKHRPLGHGWFRIDSPTTFTCVGAAGCLVTIQAMVELSNSQRNWVICSTVDDKKASPGCPVQDDANNLFGATGNTLQSAEVAAGSHTLLTRMQLREDDASTMLKRWEVHYTIYEQ